MPTNKEIAEAVKVLMEQSNIPVDMTLYSDDRDREITMHNMGDDGAEYDAMWYEENQ